MIVGSENNTSPRRRSAQRSYSQTNVHGRKSILFLVALISCVQITIFTEFNANNNCDEYSHNLPPHTLLGGHDIHHYHNVQSYPSNNSTITLVGMSHSDTTTSDAAINFLVQAACEHGMHSHILLAERDAEESLTKKIAALAHHWQPFPTDGKDAHPYCLHLIHLSVSPNKDYLWNMTEHHYIGSSFKGQLNDPLDANNRIARIKRSREYQRQKLREAMESGFDQDIGGNTNDWKMNSAIAVLDLDLMAYPSPADVVQTAIQYIFPPFLGILDKEPIADAKFHAICSHGLMVEMSRSKKNYTTRYYDIFSTILLPNSWLYRDRISPRGSLDGEDVELAKMDQVKTFHYILKQGRKSSGRENRDVIQEPYYDMVPVRSCFNGLTLYRADVWLDTECRYDTYHQNDAAYASKHYNHTCEHVVFHECLRRRMMAKVADESSRFNDGLGHRGFSMAVRPDMTTLWHLVKR